MANFHLDRSPPTDLEMDAWNLVIMSWGPKLNFDRILIQATEVKILNFEIIKPGEWGSEVDFHFSFFSDRREYQLPGTCFEMKKHCCLPK